MNLPNILGRYLEIKIEYIEMSSTTYWMKNFKVEFELRNQKFKKVNQVSDRLVSVDYTLKANKRIVSITSMANGMIG